MKGFSLGREPYAHRPATVPGRLLDIGHVNPVEIRSLLAIHLHRDEITVQHLRYARVFKRLMRHHMTPVTCRIPYAQKNWFPFELRFRQRLFTPRKPIHGIVGVLAKVRRFFGGETVGHSRSVTQNAPEAKRMFYPAISRLPSPAYPGHSRSLALIRGSLFPYACRFPGGWAIFATSLSSYAHQTHHRHRRQR